MKEFTKVLLFILICFANIKTDAQSVGGTTSGAASYCSSANSGFVSVSGFSGSILNWESSIDGGVSWTSIPNITPSQSYFSLSQSTCYRAIVQNGAFSPDTSTIVCITIYQPSVGGSITGAGNFCEDSGNGVLTLIGNTGNPLFWETSTNNGITWITIPDTIDTLNYSGITQNTLYRVIVRNGSSCPSDTSAPASFIIDSFSFAGTLSRNDSVCYGVNTGSIITSGINGNVMNWLYSTDNGITWNTNANSTTVQTYSGLTQTTLFAAVVKNNSCPADTSTAATITVYPMVIANAGNDTSILQGQSVQLNGNGSGAGVWSPGSALSGTTGFFVTATPSTTTAYTLTVSDTNGCSASDDVIITVSQAGFNGMVSNLFTPNGDGINDTWYVEGIRNFPGNEVFVYNIYGNKVFEKKEYMNDWKGTYNDSDLPDGTYYYIIKFSGQEKVLKGSIDILRSK